VEDSSWGHKKGIMNSLFTRGEGPKKEEGDQRRTVKKGKMRKERVVSKTGAEGDNKHVSRQGRGKKLSGANESESNLTRSGMGIEGAVSWTTPRGRGDDLETEKEKKNRLLSKPSGLTRKKHAPTSLSKLRIAVNRKNRPKKPPTYKEGKLSRRFSKGDARGRSG